MTRTTMLLVVAVLCACTAERKPAPAGRQPRASGPAPAARTDDVAAPTEDAPAPTDPEAAPPTALPVGKGPAPADADVGADARREAVLGILAGGEKAERLPLEATDPGRAFDPRAVDRMTPTLDGI